MLHYAGIGSRKTPTEILALMEAIATRLCSEGYILRSGGAAGADAAFAAGAAKKEVYLPWHLYNDLVPGEDGVCMTRPSPAAVNFAASFHPAWDRCSHGARLLHARNCHIVLGPDLTDPVKFIVAWTPQGKGGGGTGQALRIAARMKIPVFDLALPQVLTRLKEFACPS